MTTTSAFYFKSFQQINFTKLESYEMKYSDLQNMARQVRPGETKMEGELLALTYGAVVARVLKDYERTDEVNAQVCCLITIFNEQKLG